jgi:hypothetical protein
MVVPYGPSAAFCGSVWIHWWSPGDGGEPVDVALADGVPVAVADVSADGFLKRVESGVGLG